MPGQHIEVTGFCRRIEHPAAIFSGKAGAVHIKCRHAMHIALARALLPSRCVMHCYASRKEGVVRINGSCVR